MTETEKLQNAINNFINYYKGEEPSIIHLSKKKAAALVNENNKFLYKDGDPRVVKVDPENIPPFMFMGIKCIPKDKVIYRSRLTGELEESNTGFGLFREKDKI